MSPRGAASTLAGSGIRSRSPRCCMLRMLTARAATTPTVKNDAIDSIGIKVLMRTVSGIASVGLNALAFVNAT
jgi:hypothetical protein